MKRTPEQFRLAFLYAASTLIAACNFGSEPGSPADTPPGASAGANQSVLERSSVQLTGNGSGSDTPLTFEWIQTSGSTVTINNADRAQVSFDAPAVAAGSEVLTFRFTVTDSSGRNATDDIDVTVSDVPPGSAAGADQAVLENSLVQLSGSGAGSATPLMFAWTQIGGPTVTINNANSALASFTAPDVAAGAPEVLVFQLAVTDSDGQVATDTVAVSVSETQAIITISGRLEYQFPNPNANCDGLNFASIDVRPMRQVTVQLIDANSNALLDTMVSDDSGNYAFTSNSQSPVFVRVRSELIRNGNPSWNVEVRDNTSNTGQPLLQRPIYVLDGPASSPNGANDVRNLLATHGWTGAGFTGSRSAAPFAVLDTIYSAMQLILTADPQVNFPALDAYWSVNNTSAQGSGTFDQNIANGEIGTSFYTDDMLFLLGMDGDDIEEFDDHVIAHEWGHYFEDNFSRSDSIGGAHSLNNRLDPRVAFGEGFATALSGMALNNPVYCDTFFSGGVLRGFDIRIEDENTGSFAGWYNESSVMKILYDLWDTADDGADNSSLGFGPIYDVFVGPQSTTSALTTIFSFGEGVIAAGTGQDIFINNLLNGENIVGGGIDRWGSTETNGATGAQDVLPVYTTIVADGTPVKVCSNSQFDSVGPGATGNKLSVHRFLRMDILTRQRYTFDIQADAATLASLPVDDPVDKRDQSDPDMFYFLNGQVQNLQVGGSSEGLSGDANREIFTSFNQIPVGTYVIDFHDFRYEDTDTDIGYPRRTCFDIAVAPSP